MTSEPPARAAPRGTLSYRDVGFAYPGGAVALRGVELEIGAGELVLVVGASGSGKSTLLRCANGLVPHSSGGRFSGAVVVGDRSTAQHRPRELADTRRVRAPGSRGTVRRRPRGDRPRVRAREPRRRRADRCAAGSKRCSTPSAIAHLRDRSPATLSGGERQRCAIAGALAAAPAVLVLDEPTSQLDPQGADDVLAAVARLNADLGTTVVLAEHRLERAAPLADRAVLVAGGAIADDGAPGAVLASYAGAPAGHPSRAPPAAGTRCRSPCATRACTHRGGPTLAAASAPTPAAGTRLHGDRGARVSASPSRARRVLEHIELDVARGRGRRAPRPQRLGQDDAAAHARRAARGSGTAERPRRPTACRVAYVPQDPNSLLFAPTVAEELAATLRLLGRRDPAAVDAWLDRLDLSARRATATPAASPEASASGSRSPAVAVGGADVLLLDEPTRGMDAASRGRARARRARARGGRGAVVLATHDVELAARERDARDRPRRRRHRRRRARAREVLAGSLFAPQVLRVLPPFLTVAEVARSLAADVGARPVNRAPCRRSSTGSSSVVGARRVPVAVLPRRATRSRARPMPATRRSGLRSSARAVVAAVALEVRQGTMTGTTVALLGVLSAIAGLLRLLGLPGGGNGIYFLVILAGVAFGPRFGLLLGLLAMAVSAVVTGGIGPWLPFQMLGLGWMGARRRACSGGSPRRLRSAREVGVLAAYGWGWAFVYGAILNLWFWPFQVDGGALSYAPDAVDRARRCTTTGSFYVATSFAWDAAGALGERDAHRAHRRARSCEACAASPVGSIRSSSSNRCPPPRAPEPRGRRTEELTMAAPQPGEPTLRVEHHGPVAKLTLNRPERRNALSLAAMRELHRRAAPRSAPTTRRGVIVIAGAGPVFSAGHDLSEMVDRPAEFYDELFATCVELMTAVHEIPQPVIAASTASRPRPAASSSPRATSRSPRPTRASRRPGVNIGLFCSTPMVPIDARDRAQAGAGDAAHGRPDRRRHCGRVGPREPHRAAGAARRRGRRARGTHQPFERRGVVALGKRAFYAQDGLTEADAYDVARARDGGQRRARRRARRHHRVPGEAAAESWPA